jgi:hypothetical protein
MSASDHLREEQFFHGTTAQQADSIVQSGLRSTFAGNYTLHRIRAAAEGYGDDVKGYDPEGRAGLIQVTIPKRVAAAYIETAGHPETPEEVDDGSGNRAWLRRTIPPKYIRRAG